MLKTVITKGLVGLAYLFIALLFGHCKSNLKEAPVLLYGGTGTSPNDVKAIETILSAHHIDYALATTAQLNEADSTQLKKYKLIIIPGGNFIDIGKGLTAATVSRIRQSVYQGMNYLGICAGGFLAGSTPGNCFNFTNGVSFRFYADEDKGIRKEAVAITNADGTMVDHYWEDGPQLSGWGEVISTYPDGTPATVQGDYGRGHIILTGIHAEAPESWRKEFPFSTPMEKSHDYAAKLIRAALDKTPETHF